MAPGTDHGILRLDGGAATVWADDQIQEQALSGSVHVFTADDGHSQMQSVQAAMTRAGIRWRLAYIQYEERSRLTHYTWNIELEAA
ncbi:MAG: hypothetical protein J6K32_12925 [Clostridia bacterium]|nr:hypothetical protein [Clostridia bacterium]